MSTNHYKYLPASFAPDCIVPSLSTNITHVACNGGTNAAIDLILAGGTSPFTYSWTGPGGFTASSQDLTAIAAGSYTVIVTATGGCSTTGTFIVNQPGTLVLSSGSTNVTCNGAGNGTASASATGGTGPYTYSWTTNTTVSIPANKDNSIYEANTGNSNGAGDSFVAGTTGSGSKNRALISFDIAGNIPSGATISNASLQIYLSQTSVGPKTHLLHKLNQGWGEGTSVASASGQGIAATTNDATWLNNFYPSSNWSTSGGSFNAVASASTLVNGIGFYAWSSPGMASDIQAWLNTPANNFGWLLKSDETSSQQAKRYSSRENATVANRPALTVSYSSIVASGNNVSNLSPGTYTLIVTDANNCTTSTTITITQPAALSASCSGTNVTCNGASDGTASVNVSGGTGPYTYSWTDGTGTSNTIKINPSKDNSIYEANTSNSNGAGESFVAGTTGTGSKNRALISFDIDGNIPSGAVISNASLQIYVSHTNGSGPKTHLLHKLNQDWGEGTSSANGAGQGIAATNTDATWLNNFYPGSNWSTPGGSFNAVASASTVVDNIGSYTWSSATMVSDIQSWLNNPANNFGWLLKSDETSTQQAKRYSSRENSIEENRPVLNVDYITPDILGTSNALANLGPGSYTVIVTDANGCTATCTYTVTEPASIVVTATAGTIACNGGTTSVTVSATGGSGNYTTGTGTFMGVSAGSHTYTVTDNNGCTGSTTITINEPLPITVSFSGLAGSYCVTDAAVTLTGSPAGGTFSGPGISGNSFNPATAGIGGPYTIIYTYTNGNGCTNSSSQQVSVTVCGSTITLNMKLYLQGYYAASGTMQPVLNIQGVTAALATETDSVAVELHDAITYALVDSKLAVLNTNGLISATFTQPAGNYYIGIKHRSSIETWSTNPVTCSVSTALYDFSSAANMAMGDNQAEVEPGVWAIYTGDLNHDDFIDGSDFPLYDSESASGGLFDGTYTATDMNGDGFVDGSDFPVFDGNSANGVTAVHP